MSTILKALRRLEHEKKRTDRPLREQVTGPGGDRGDLRPQRRWPVLLGGIGAGVFAGLAVLLLVLSRGDPAQEAAPAAAPPEARVAAPPAPAAPPVEPRRRRRRVPAQAATAAVPGALVPAAQPAGLDPDVSEPAANETAPIRQGPSEGLAQGSAPLEEVAVIDRGGVGPREIAEAAPAAEGEPAAPKPGSVRPLHRGGPAGLPGSHLLPEGSELPVAEPGARASAQRPALEPVPVPARAPAPPPPRPEPVRAADPAPRVAEPTPAEVPRAGPAPAPRASSARPPAPAFPALRVEQTTWHPLAERRVAVIEVPGSVAQSVHEGDLVAGALVKRIEPSAVVFEHGGREVRRRIGVGRSD